MSRDQRLVLIASILGSFVAFLDIAVVNVALPAIRVELGGGLAAQQWIVDAYLLALGALILTAGALSDRFGRKRVFAGGLVGFALTSLLCAAAPNIQIQVLVPARVCKFKSYRPHNSRYLRERREVRRPQAARGNGRELFSSSRSAPA